jgi:hypothetical protein
MLAPPIPEAYVADRGFARIIHARVARSESARILLLGQVGVGKSTELWALERDLASTYCVVRPPVDSVLNLAGITWPELLVYSALWAAASRGEGHSGPVRALEDALGQRVDEMAAVMRAGLAGGEGVQPLLRSGSITVGPAVPSLAGPAIVPPLLQRFRGDSAQLRGRIRAAASQCWEIAISTFRHLEKTSGLPLLLLVDGLEKVPDESARALYHEERKWAAGLPFRAVITAPVWLSFEPYFGDVEEAFTSVERLRALAPDGPGGSQSFLLALAKKRDALEVFPEEVLREALRWSGGLPRQFLQLLAEAAGRALADGLSRATPLCMLRARRRVAERFQYQLGPEDSTELSRPDSERKPAARACNGQN